jgi:hypothetical protein
MDHGQGGFRDLRITPSRDGDWFEAKSAKTSVTIPSVGDDHGLRHDRAFDETAERIGAAIRHHDQSNTSRATPGFPFIERGISLPPPHFDSTSDQHLIVDATPLAACSPTHPGFVRLHMSIG